MFTFTKLLSQNFNSTAKIVVNQGGTSAGKTFNIIECLILKAIEKEVIITIVAQDIPNLKKGAIRDTKNIINQNTWINQFLKGDSYSNAWNISNSILTFKNGSIIEFNSYDDEQDARGGRRDYLFLNEANAIDFEIYWQLFIRTASTVYIDYNPSAKFWVHDKILPREDAELIISDHRQNIYISDALHREIEAIEDPETFKVYARGLTGKVTGLVFHNWRMCESFPKDCTNWVYGMDFGYSNSYTTLVKVGEFGGELYIEELVYERGLQNEDILIYFKTLGISTNQLIICDSNEPKTRDWLYSKGYNIVKTRKGGDTNPSVNYGISLMKSYRINITQDSTNTKKEFEKYAWKTKDGEALNEPIKMFDHCFIGSTKILMENGTKRIYNVKIGEVVITPFGKRKVLKKWENGIKKVNKYLMQFDTFSLYLCSTDNHLIRTKNGWKQIKDITTEDEIYLHNFTKELNLHCTKEKSIFHGITEGCMSLFGKRKIIKKFLRAFMSTILMRIPITMIFQILESLKVKSIYQNMGKGDLQKIQNGQKDFTQKVSQKLLNGINLKMESNGIQNMDLEHGKIEQQKPIFVSIAEKNMQQDTLALQNSVITTAKLKHFGCVESWSEKVYDLEIEKDHCYFANGILVHNSIDASRYGFTEILGDTMTFGYG